MKSNRSHSFALVILALAATSIGLSAEPTSAKEDWRTYRQSFLPALEVTADGEMREVTDPVRIRAMINRDAPDASDSRFDRKTFWGRVLGDFDVNGDGRLDEQERAAVHAAITAGQLHLAPRSTRIPPVKS